ncbi:Mur ligase family protein [Caldimonas brevitalea]|uniref:UDP-N-acetylmuramoylalanine--D-glutamate ligase n=1 Tax=Caldimonas brevitalea TaxID=413882 RepID=A0A0G3BIQ9_9BURK|nr:Mur ligase family protein [Caldimonas brevitalea]AKJ27868.1 UDP-N-acetylmuramoylalanine--D-glutamate ligase [Caldimonas brevitalea]
MKDLQGITVLVLGLGDSGLAMARWCARFGADVRVWDSREAPPQAEALRQHVPQAQLLTGELPMSALDGVRRVLKSPGLSPRDERLAPVLDEAAERGVLVQGELELFARALADLKAERRYTPRVVAITGTNGKTTTTSMTALLIERTGRRVGVAGNIGPTLLQTLADALDLEPAPADETAGEGLEVAPPEAAATPADTTPEADQAPSTPAALAAEQRGAAVSSVPVGVDPLPEESAAVTPESDAPDETPSPEELADLRTLDGAAEDAQPGADIDTEADALAEATAGPVGVADETAGVADDEALAAVPPLADDDSAVLQLAPPPPAEPVFEHLPEVWVLELSSFQLDSALGFEPSAATVLNVTEDHLDWHGDLASYAAAKARIFGKQAVMVVNREDPMVEAMIPPPEVIKSTGRGKPARVIERAVVRFGLDAPRRPGDFGLVTENGMAWLVRAREADETVASGRGRRRAAGDEPQEEEELQLQRLMPADALRVRGRHNAANALAALALATAIGCPLAPMLHGLREYAGEPHRVEFVATVNGVDFFDDSKGTNVGATVAALNGLGLDRAPARLLVILGGDGKGQDFAPLAAPLARHARFVALIGRDAARIETALEGSGVPAAHFETLQAATRACAERAHTGDAVLLSPACASLDMFRNYAHRAEVFVAEVQALAGDQGEVA